MTNQDSLRFQFLHTFWPDLAELGRKAEMANGQEPELVAIRLRGFTETMVIKLLDHLTIPYDPGSTHFDRVVLLDNVDLLDARLLSKFHTIRKIGNNAAHSRVVTADQVISLLEDAWSLSCWFCRFMRPDIDWDTPVPGDSPGVMEQSGDEPEVTVRNPTGDGRKSNVLKFPEDSILRIREQVSRALLEVDPRVRNLRTKITLPEAFTESLAVDQISCLEEVQKFLFNSDERVFLLKGYAGTGKTFLTKGITEFLAAQGRAFRIAAPTGRAAKVIEQKTGRTARTVHSSIYNFGDLREYKPGDDEPGSETFKFYAEISPNQDGANTVYIVDEASLLSDAYSESEFFRSGSGYLLRDLIDYVGFTHGETDRKIIFVGDAGQLPPVGMPASPALDAAYLRKNFGIVAREYQLTEILRQRADSGVLKNVKLLRTSLEKNSFGSLRFDFDQDVQRLRTDEVLPVYMSLNADIMQSASIIVTHSNAEAAEFNRSIRDVLFPGRSSVVKGDRLVVTANTMVQDGFLANGEFLDVVEAETFVERRTVTLRQRNPDTGVISVIEVPLIFRDVEVTISTSDGNGIILKTKVLDDYLHDGRAGIDSAQQRALYVDFLKRHPDVNRDLDRKRVGQILRQDPYFNALRVKFGYAVTCHKAQGGEWENVFVSCPTGLNPRTADYFRWLYTAMTRSSSRLYLINPPDIRIKVSGPEWWLGQQEAAEAIGVVDTVDAVPVALPSVSPQEAFRLAVFDQVQRSVEAAGISISDVAHHQYQEAFYLIRDLDSARVNISYNGRYKITGVVATAAGAFGDELGILLGHLAGKEVGITSSSVAVTGSSELNAPTRSFLKDFHDRLVPLLEASEIKVVAFKEQQWSQRYTFGRGNDVASVDVFYDKKDRLTNCMPVAGKGHGSRSGTLLPDVVRILTEQIAP